MKETLQRNLLENDFKAILKYNSMAPYDKKILVIEPWVTGVSFNEGERFVFSDTRKHIYKYVKGDKTTNYCMECPLKSSSHDHLFNCSRPDGLYHVVDCTNEVMLEVNDFLLKNATDMTKVNAESEYKRHKFECIDVIADVKGWYTAAEFCMCNAFKYNWRLGHKDDVFKESDKIKTYMFIYQKLVRRNLIWYNNRKPDYKVGVIEVIGNTVIYFDGTRKGSMNIIEFRKEFTNMEEEALRKWKEEATRAGICKP